MTYHDPLHIPSERLVIYRLDGTYYLLNKALLDQQNCWDNLEEIKETHFLKMCVYDLLKDSKVKDLPYWDDLLNEIEFYLQELWGFEKNVNYHRFWERPKCSCPKLDNEDSYPFQRLISSKCLLHGDV